MDPSPTYSTTMQPRGLPHPGEHLRLCLSDAELKTLVIRMLTEIVQYRRKIEEEMKAMQNKIKKIYREPTVKERKLGLKSMIWNRRNKHLTRTE